MMIELRLMGPVQLSGPPGTAVDAVLVHPKRLALLSYLAVSSSTEPLVSREGLLALFWPESDERRAREALRQGLRFLRRSLGPEPGGGAAMTTTYLQHVTPGLTL
jgi:DNA-binding SARP family transcriptional activator